MWMKLIVKDWKKLLVNFNMFMLLFDIDASNNCRCHQYCLTLLWICVLLINCCGTTETTTLKFDVAARAAAANSPVISPTPVKQPKPSSVIYIPSLDGNNAFVLYIFFFYFSLSLTLYTSLLISIINFIVATDPKIRWTL